MDNCTEATAIIAKRDKMASQVRPGCHWHRDGVGILAIQNKKGKSLFIHYRAGGFTVGARMSHAECLALENEAKALWQTLPE
jgi:hypothetical protein